MTDKNLSELISEMIRAEETAAAARDLVCEYMGAHEIKSGAIDGYAVSYIAAGFRTAYSDGYKVDPAFKAAKAAYDAARAPYAYKAKRDAYIRVKAI